MRAATATTRSKNRGSEYDVAAQRKKSELIVQPHIYQILNYSKYTRFPVFARLFIRRRRHHMHRGERTVRLNPQESSIRGAARC